MTYHEWGDGFDFNRLEQARLKIMNHVTYVTGYSLICKEKYGSIRYERLIPPKKGRPEYSEDSVWKIIYMYIKVLITKEFPDLEDELLEDFAIREEIVGKDVYDKYWTSL